MIKYIKENCVDFYKECHDWKEAIVYAGYLLEKNGYIDHQYINDMVNIIEKNGPYIVVMPGVALAHARPNGHVYQNSISLVTFKNGVKFGHSVNDPVRVLLALAAKSDEEHLKLFQEVALCLMDRKYLHKIFNARSYQDILKDNKNIDAIKGGTDSFLLC